MNKNELITTVSERSGFTKKDVGEVVDCIISTITEVLKEGEDVKIQGFGNFTVLSRGERIGRNPKDGSPINISASKLPKFKPSLILKNIVNGV